MKPKTEEFFSDCNPATIKALASRIGNTETPARKFVTRQEAGGVRVWRLK